MFRRYTRAQVICASLILIVSGALTWAWLPRQVKAGLGESVAYSQVAIAQLGCGISTVPQICLAPGATFQIGAGGANWSGHWQGTVTPTYVTVTAQQSAVLSLNLLSPTQTGGTLPNMANGTTSANGASCTVTGLGTVTATNGIIIGPMASVVTSVSPTAGTLSIQVVDFLSASSVTPVTPANLVVECQTP